MKSAPEAAACMVPAPEASTAAVTLTAKLAATPSAHYMVGVSAAAALKELATAVTVTTATIYAVL